MPNFIIYKITAGVHGGLRASPSVVGNRPVAWLMSLMFNLMLILMIRLATSRFHIGTTQMVSSAVKGLIFYRKAP